MTPEETSLTAPHIALLAASGIKLTNGALQPLGISDWTGGAAFPSSRSSRPVREED
jgi:hypothetical protein